MNEPLPNNLKLKSGDLRCRHVSLAVTVAICFLLAPAFRPRFIFQLGDGWGLLFSQIYLCVATVTALVLLLFRARRLSLSSAAICFLTITVLISTIANGGDCRSWLDAWLPCILAVCVVSYFRRIELLYAIYVLTLTLSVINSVSMIVWPDGMLTNSVYFYGNRNAVYQLIFPCTLCGLCLDCSRESRIPLLSIVAFVFSVAQLLFGGSKTSLIAYAFLVAGALLILKKPFRPLGVYLVGIITSFLGTLLVVVLRVQEHFGLLLQVLFGKSVTLSGRAPLWDLVFSLLDIDHLLIGRGVSGHETLIVGDVHLYYAHNMYLELLFISGVLGLIAFGVAIASCGSNLRQSAPSKEKSLVALTIGAYCIVGVTESMIGPSFFMVIALVEALCSASRPKLRKNSEADLAFALQGPTG